MTHRTRRPERGFTLVEVMVALLVMAIMAGMAWQGVDGIVRTRDASQARLERTLRFNTVIAQWDQDLASLQENTAVTRALSCDGASVRLVRRTPEGLQIVAWSLRPEAGGTSGWVRWAGPAVTTTAELAESWLRSQQLQGDETGSLKTISGLASWQVYFFRNNSWSNCQSSGDVAVTTGATAGTPRVQTAEVLPSGVRIVLAFAPGGDIAGELTRDTLLQP